MLFLNLNGSEIRTIFDEEQQDWNKLAERLNQIVHGKWLSIAVSLEEELAREREKK